MSRRQFWLVTILDALLLVGVVTLIASCGVQGSLVRPKDIPAYEKKRQEKLERQQREEQEVPRIVVE